MQIYADIDYAAFKTVVANLGDTFKIFYGVNTAGFVEKVLVLFVSRDYYVQANGGWNQTTTPATFTADFPTAILAPINGAAY